VYTLPSQTDSTRDCSEWRLLRAHQHERLEQQHESAELANPTWVDQTHGTIRWVDLSAVRNSGSNWMEVDVVTAVQ